jgi:flagellar biosynthesis/type III secretory pathway protein FliH
MPQSKRKTAASASDGAEATRKRTKRRKLTGQKALRRRKPALRKRFIQKDNELAGSGETFNNGFNAGFAKGFEDGHQLAYEQQP